MALSGSQMYLDWTAIQKSRELHKQEHMSRCGQPRCPLPWRAEQENLSHVSVIFQGMVSATEALIDVMALEANLHYFSL